MTSLRSNLAGFIVTLLVWQFAALVSSPFALCAGVEAHSAGDHCGMPCCKGLAPGQICPMCRTSQTHRSASGPTWRCDCAVPDAALTSLIGMAGLVVPARTVGVSPLMRAGTVVHSSDSSFDIQLEPFLPPPRA